MEQPTLKSNFSQNRKMLGARVPLPLVARFERSIPVGQRSQFIVDALAAALDRHVGEEERVNTPVLH